MSELLQLVILTGSKSYFSGNVCCCFTIYNRHSEEKIRKLESAGLGFSTKVTLTKQRLGTWTADNH